MKKVYYVTKSTLYLLVVQESSLSISLQISPLFGRKKIVGQNSVPQFLSASLLKVYPNQTKWDSLLKLFYLLPNSLNLKGMKMSNMCNHQKRSIKHMNLKTRKANNTWPLFCSTKMSIASFAILPTPSSNRALISGRPFSGDICCINKL